MASGRAHAALSTVALVAVPVALWAYHVEVPIGAVAVGLLVGLAISPDLDQEQVKTHDEARWRRIPVVGILWSCYWWLYAKVMPHRSIWSHLPVLGTAIRALYLGAPFWLALMLMGATVPSVPPEWIAWAFVGWALQDTLHWAVDWAHSMMIRAF